MAGKVCFILNNRRVYMDQCLVEDEIPVFFTCVDEEGIYYVALCADMDMLRYCVVKTSVLQLNNMLLGKLPMRGVFTGQDFYWEVIPADDSVENDMVINKPVDTMEPEDLPEEGAYFRLYSKELQRYADSINRELIRGDFESFPMRTNDALGDIDDGSKILQKGTIFVTAETYCESREIEYTAMLKATKTLLLEYGKEEDCVQVKEKRSVDGGQVMDKKIEVDSLTDKAFLSFAA